MPGYQRAEDVLEGARTTLEMVQLALEDFRHGDRPGRRLAGLRNVIVWGRAVTNVVQKIAHFQPAAFDKWYAPYQDEMQRNEPFKYLYQLRSQVLKEGLLGRTTVSVRINTTKPVDLGKLLGDPPHPGAAWFIGDPLGGSGWKVALPDGSIERFYKELPDSTDAQITTAVHFADATIEKKLSPPAESIDKLLTDYVGYLTHLVEAAQREFGHK
jgi:hypothetical protein